MIDDLKKDTEDTPEVPAVSGGAPEPEPEPEPKATQEPAPVGDAAPKKKKKKVKTTAKPTTPAPAKPATDKKKTAKPDKKKTAKPDKKKTVKSVPVHKEDMFRPESRLGVAFALLKDGKPHTKKEIAAAIKKKCGSVPWPHRIFGHLRARAAETGKFLLKEPERGVFVMTLRK